MSEAAHSVSIVTQTCVRPERAEDFARWQGETSTLIANFPGFIEQRLMPPKPPLQVDWVILQRFDSLAAAQRWLSSPERQTRIEGVAPLLMGRDDVHIVQDDASAVRASPVSAVISTRVKPGKETEYRAWERKMAAAQSKAPGLQGYRFEPAVPGVQESCVAILRFDSEANLQAWLDSPQRKKLVDEANPLTEEFHTRLARTGFEQWFRDISEPGSAPPPAWKMNFLVLLMLYPVVFLWSIWFGLPILTDKYHMSFAIALFIGNIFSVGLTGVLVPWAAGRFGWWLVPSAHGLTKANLLGTGIILALYAAMVAGFYFTSP
jgi:antibiotic biosynthesis monooxygenase (ABM) superfamily enzyme